MKNGKLIAGTALLVVLAWTAMASIEWRVQSGNTSVGILSINAGDTRVELGLRDDGIVVWRKITNTTNSPSERNDILWFQGVVLTNMYWSANTYIPTTTNAIWMDLSNPGTNAVTP